MKFKFFLVAAILTLVSSFNLMAQVTNPCGGSGDPDDPTTCPLDSGVVILVVVALIFASVQLYRRQQAQNAR